MLLINNRIVKATIAKIHQLRDSYAALPVSLKTFKKDDFNYQHLHESKRDKHKPEILEYLRHDCEYLHDIILKFRVQFGDVDTMASAAMRELRKFHELGPDDEWRMNANTDSTYREFFYGGRVECFQAGIIKQPMKIYDVNSMYPAVMREFLHPISNAPIVTKKIGRNTCFVEVEGESFGAFPRRELNGLSFAHSKGIYKVSIHEFNAAIETGTFKLKRVISSHNFLKRICFDEFVEHFNAKKIQCEIDGDKTHRTFWKLVMNSAYGKWAQDPRDFHDYEFRDFNDPLPVNLCVCLPMKHEMEGPPLLHCRCKGWTWVMDNPEEGWRLWAKPSAGISGYYNIATAASITGAARAVLLRAIVSSTKPVYCDTDSLICQDIGDVRLDEKELGCWKSEGSGTIAAICGKKTYAVFEDGKCVKMASKGARLTPKQIMSVARGRTIIHKNLAPSFRLDGSADYITRKIRRTA